ncbi:gTPase Der [Coraliomargarita sp. CAG:312]|nr:gTPase Der [Coraliomargarita sp. CAG:312]
MPSSDEKSIALVGRPNVGKSRLFNRLLSRRVSIVHDKPGVTRDIVVEKLSDNILLMDTGGMFAAPGVTEKIIADATNEQANFAIVAADTIIFVVDSQEGLTSLDEEIASILRSSGKRVILAVNKVDLPMHSERAAEFFNLGFKDVVEVSAEHGYGMDSLRAAIESCCGKIIPPSEDDAKDRIKICVAGRPNVGKSSIANRLIGEDRLIVSEIAGTTRDSVKFDIDAFSKRGAEMKFRLFDTAGLRTKRKINTSLDYLSSLRTRRAIESCDVVFLVLDAMEGVSELDKRLLSEIMDIGASVIVVVNKWDYATHTFARRPLNGYKDISDFGKKFDAAVRAELPAIGDSPIYFVSALENKGVDKLLESAFRMYSKMNSTIPTGKLNAAVKKLLDANPPRYISGKRLKVYYCVKTSSRPFTVKMFCNSLQSFTDPYKRYLVNGIRDSFKLGGVAIRLDLIGKVSQTIQERFQNKK